MKTTNIYFAVGFAVVYMLLLVSACENNQRNDQRTLGGVESEKSVITEQAGDVYETPEEEYATRRDNASANIEQEIRKIVDEQNMIRRSLETASGSEYAQLEERLNDLEERKDHLQHQQTQISEGGWEELEMVEKNLEEVLSEGVETLESDRSVRGEGTSLDGPDLNRTGTRTGTEVEKRQSTIESDLENLNP